MSPGYVLVWVRETQDPAYRGDSRGNRWFVVDAIRDNVLGNFPSFSGALNMIRPVLTVEKDNVAACSLLPTSCLMSWAAFSCRERRFFIRPAAFGRLHKIQPSAFEGLPQAILLLQGSGQTASPPCGRAHQNKDTD